MRNLAKAKSGALIVMSQKKKDPNKGIFRSFSSSPSPRTPSDHPTFFLFVKTLLFRDEVLKLGKEKLVDEERAKGGNVIVTSFSGTINNKRKTKKMLTGNLTEFQPMFDLKG